jgi:hypothetical protein
MDLDVLDNVPIQGGSYVRVDDIPLPFREQFISDTRGQTKPLPLGESGACAYVWDWQDWLRYRREPDYAPRFNTPMID